MIETPYSKKYKLDGRINKLDKQQLEILQNIMNDVIDGWKKSHRYSGISAFTKLMREHEDYKRIKLNGPLMNKHVIGYCIDINPKTTWKNCNCGGTGNWRVNG